MSTSLEILLLYVSFIFIFSTFRYLLCVTNTHFFFLIRNEHFLFRTAQNVKISPDTITLTGHLFGSYEIIVILNLYFGNQ